VWQHFTRIMSHCIRLCTDTASLTSDLCSDLRESIHASAMSCSSMTGPWLATCTSSTEPISLIGYAFPPLTSLAMVDGNLRLFKSWESLSGCLAAYAHCASLPQGYRHMPPLLSRPSTARWVGGRDPLSTHPLYSSWVSLSMVGYWSTFHYSLHLWSHGTHLLNRSAC